MKKEYQSLIAFLRSQVAAKPVAIIYGVGKSTLVRELNKRCKSCAYMVNSMVYKLSFLKKGDKIPGFLNESAFKYFAVEYFVKNSSAKAIILDNVLSGIHPSYVYAGLDNILDYAQTNNKFVIVTTNDPYHYLWSRNRYKSTALYVNISDTVSRAYLKDKIKIDSCTVSVDENTPPDFEGPLY